MKRYKYKKYKKYKDILKDTTAKALERSSERAKEQLKQSGQLRLIRDLERNEYDM